MTKQKILITGVAGFIGSSLAQELTKGGNDVIGVDDLNDMSDVEMKQARLVNLFETLKGDSFRFFKMSINDEATMKSLFAEHRFDIVVHLAAHAGVRNSLQYPQKFLTSNVLGFEVVLRLCRDFSIPRLLFASSSSVYGERSDLSPFKESDNTSRPVSIYAASKKANELLAYSYSELYNMSITGLRFFTVYGPWVRTDMATYLFMESISKNRPITIFNDGEMQRDFTYVDDVVEVLKALVVKPDEKNDELFKILNVGNESTVSVNDFISTMERLMGKCAIKKFQPAKLGDVSSTYSDTTRLYKYIGYKPRTLLEDGLRKTVKWYWSIRS